MSRSLQRLLLLRARLKRYAEAEHARAQSVHSATLEGIAATDLPQSEHSGAQLIAHDQKLSLLWRQEAHADAARAASRTRLLHEVGEHKKIEKVLDARAHTARLQAARRDAQMQEAWLRHRLHAQKKGR